MQRLAKDIKSGFLKHYVTVRILEKIQNRLQFPESHRPVIDGAGNTM
jgi:hypothetical protein